MNDLQLILTSTLAATATAAVINGGLAIVGQYFERKSRCKETILKAALEAGRSRAASALEVLKITGNKVRLPDEVMLTGTYYQWIKHLDKTGELPQVSAGLKKRGNVVALRT